MEAMGIKNFHRNISTKYLFTYTDIHTLLILYLLILKFKLKMKLQYNKIENIYTFCKKLTED